MSQKQLSILLAPDSFKESLSATAVCMAMAEGISKVNPQVNIISKPLADGGEGTLEALINGNDGEIFYEEVFDPIGNKIKAPYGIIKSEKVAVIEMAKASGLMLVSLQNRNPLITTTYGTGQLIKACLEHDVKKIIICIGGSATNDGGVGAMQALGISFKDANLQEVNWGGGNLHLIKIIDDSNLDHRIKNVKIEVACDVQNTLCGDFGASKVFAKQKGAGENAVAALEENMLHYGKLLQSYCQEDIFTVKGLGAAGGLGSSLYAFLKAELRPGVDIVIEHYQLEKIIKDVDLIWTGEGSLDLQTAFGKAPLGLAKLAMKHHKFVIALTGRIGAGVECLQQAGISAVFGIIDQNATDQELFAKAHTNISRTSENIMRLIYFKHNNEAIT